MACEASPFSDFTVPPDPGIRLPVDPPPVRVVPEPSAFPAVEAPDAGPLVEVGGGRITALAVYHQACLPAAVPVVWLRRAVADRLSGAVAALPPRFGLAVFDGWRPLELQRFLHADAVARLGEAGGFVSEPSADPRRPPPHLTGGAVDLTLTFDGEALALGTCFDAFVARSAADAFEDEPGVVRTLRRLLHQVMTSAGFVPLASEWWHFEYGTPRWAALRQVAPLYGPVEPV